MENAMSNRIKEGELLPNPEENLSDQEKKAVDELRAVMLSAIQNRFTGETTELFAKNLHKDFAREYNSWLIAYEESYAADTIRAMRPSKCMAVAKGEDDLVIKQKVEETVLDDKGEIVWKDKEQKIAETKEVEVDRPEFLFHLLIADSLTEVYENNPELTPRQLRYETEQELKADAATASGWEDGLRHAVYINTDAWKTQEWQEWKNSSLVYDGITEGYAILSAMTTGFDRRLQLRKGGPFPLESDLFSDLVNQSLDR